MTEYLEKAKVLDYLNKCADGAQADFDENGGESGIYVECLEDVIQDITSMPGTDVVPVELFDDLRNELCLHCGKYTLQHFGACDGCKWRNNDE